MDIEVTNLNIGERVMVDTNEWPVDAKVSLYDEHGTYLVVEYDNWKYLVETKDFTEYVIAHVQLRRAINC